MYHKPERQADISSFIAYLQQTFEEQSVGEIACGTGYWTQHVAPTAHSVVATDINGETLEIAKTQPFPRQNVTFSIADVYTLPEPTQPLDAGFGGFIWYLSSIHRIGYLFDLHHHSLGVFR